MEGSVSIYNLNKIIFIIYFCVAFCILSRHMLFSLIFFTAIFLAVTIFIFIRIFFVWNILTLFIFLNIIFTCISIIILIINLNIIITIIIFLIVFIDVFFICIIFDLITSVIIFCFDIIKLYQRNIDWLKSMFAGLDNCLTADRCILLKFSFFDIPPVIIFIFILRCNMNLAWTICWTRNNWQCRRIILFFICQCYVRYWSASVVHDC